MDKKTLTAKTVKDLRTISSNLGIKIPTGAIKDDIVGLLISGYKKQQRLANKQAKTSQKNTTVEKRVQFKTPEKSDPSASTRTTSTRTKSPPVSKTQRATPARGATSTRTKSPPVSKTQRATPARGATSTRTTSTRTKSPPVSKDTKAVSKDTKAVSKSADGKYSILEQLGSTGKEGTTFLVRTKRGDEYAMKTFAKQKSNKNLRLEAQYQRHVASFGLAPQIKDINENDKYIVMDRLDKNLFDIVKKNNGEIPEKIQKKIIQVIVKMDDTGVFHGDPNPANFMLKGNSMYMIDYGFARDIDEKLIRKYETNTPNKKFMILGLILKLKEIYRDHNPHIEYKVLSKMLENS